MQLDFSKIVNNLTAGFRYALIALCLFMFAKATHGIIGFFDKGKEARIHELEKQVKDDTEIIKQKDKQLADVRGITDAKIQENVDLANECKRLKKIIDNTKVPPVGPVPPTTEQRIADIAVSGVVFTVIPNDEVKTSTDSLAIIWKWSKEAERAPKLDKIILDRDILIAKQDKLIDKIKTDFKDSLDLERTACDAAKATRDKKIEDLEKLNKELAPKWFNRLDKVAWGAGGVALGVLIGIIL